MPVNRETDLVPLPETEGVTILAVVSEIELKVWRFWFRAVGMTEK